MRWLQQIRTRVHDYYLKKFPSAEVSRSIVNYYDAKTIALLVDASKTDVAPKVLQFIQQLSNDGKKTEALFLFKNKKQAEGCRYPYFTFNDCNFWLFPPKNITDTWAEKQFDLLISIHTYPCLPLEYLSAVSKSKYRIGKYIVEKPFCYDLMVYTQENTDIASYLTQVDQLLKTINQHAKV